MGFAHGFLAAFVTLETETVRFLRQQAGMLALMRSVAAHAPLAEWRMNILFLILTAFMTSVAEFLLFLDQQAGMGRIMACVTGGAVPFSHRLVDGNRARFRRNRLMAAQTQIRLILS